MDEAPLYTKHFIALESDPDLFTTLAHKLGLDSSVAFQDVLSLDDPELLALIPRPVLALILVFPASATYESRKAEEEALLPSYAGKGEDEPVLWFRQRINNACGLYGLLHAVCNGPEQDLIMPGSTLASLRRSCIPLAPKERADVLENSEPLEEAYKEVAMQGQSALPENAEDEVDYHYVCFVKSQQDGHLYELDGDRKGPVDKGPMPASEDMLGPSALQVVKQFMDTENGQDPSFSLMALTAS